MKFADVISRLKAGEMVRRSCWPSCMFLFQQVPAKIPIELVPKMSSLPDSVKSVFLNRGLPAIEYYDQVVIVDSQNQITYWSVTHGDLLADDWEVYPPDVPIR